MSSYNQKTIMEKLKKNKKELIDIMKAVKESQETKEINIIQFDINEKLKNMSERNHCEELQYSIMKKFYHIVDAFEENNLLNFTYSVYKDKEGFKKLIIDEYKNYLNYFKNEEYDFFAIFFINRNIKQCLLNYEQDNGASFNVVFEIVSELTHIKQDALNKEIEIYI